MATEVEHPVGLVQQVSTPGSSTPQDVSPTSAHKMDQTPSPSTSTHNGQPPSSQSRRPPRKSTLTQQQKNQKRQRATQDQLTTLEVEFNKNPTPTATVRERIAEEINMTERSVQIWFQNRRAKIKLLAKKSLETGEDIDSIPESMRAYLAMQAMESGKGLGGPFLGRTGLLPYGHNNMLLGGDQNGQGKVLIHHLTCRSLSIGKWTRVGQNTMDLIIFYSPDKCTMTYYINNEQAGYKIEYPFAYIKNIFLENQEGDPNKPGGIVIELNRAPNFFMDSSPQASGFFQCGDFTEDQQASHCLVHHLGGNPKVLSGQLAKLVSLEAFMNRNNPHPFIDQQHALSMSAPVSPSRPSSQPNFAQPHVGMFQESWGINHMHPGMRGPGHKRQRSRSVPMAVDFSMLQTPMPSFYIQQPGEMAAPQTPGPNIYAPIPQAPGGLGPNLRIDTQAGFGLDMRQYPMSATTASPSEFPTSPNFFSQGPEPSPLPAASSYNTPYGSAFLSPMAHPSPSMIPPSVSPLSFGSHHGEPSIVEQSPPLSMLGRSASADIYQQGDNGSCAVSDDGTGLNEMYSKHTINLPMHPHSPAYGEQGHNDLDMNQLVQFDHVDPNSMSPESMHQTPH
ncbi:homeobox domain-containing protein [Colletotrichum paranaense]|uniref:Homeobox domain-containing protein n=9 Tax=Colletotrichum acutatum species complex TaxID=2707335 RepID=A0A9Q0AXS8_9PEZI|nr:homeobox domain-containing protein [Colletotrichum lupini]XP_060320171.1 homeobox domain-containing protein [Colletotrichum costaricense]XP_060348775.1 homeobox domain-containing protein [Colletotrichum paranaense]XP_060377257.1 homeobox domain-containing protein [Colletotrichum tamarilloi]XP_060397598.1 homeobox domain-containing protein [Colletotrichum abscissum]KAK0372331.1 homeobox domain-containing protein [Colletotrichum limetticola]KAK1453572.1 homeobox domain-containing protein [Co